MSEVYYFQRYHKREDMHSSNALLLLKRVYYYKPRLFYGVIAGFTDFGLEEFLPSFWVQGRENRSVPDFCIHQNGFKIVVEAKEKYNFFSEDQIRRHLESFDPSSCETKIFIALAPKFSGEDRDVFERVKKDFPALIFVPLTYFDLYQSIKDLCDDVQDTELVELLEEFREYCGEENLIDDTDSTIMVRLAGATMDFNVDPNNNIYYDNFKNRYEGFRYLGLYANKQIKYLGEIQKIVKAYVAEGDLKMQCLYPSGGKIEEGERERILRAMGHQKGLYDNVAVPHCYFLTDKFVPVENFTKSSKMALYGRKKFYLSQFSLPPKSRPEEIAARMKNKTWEEVERH